MKCPVCSSVDLSSALTRSGVMIDRCPQCQGIWLDKSEIFHFTRTPTYLRFQIDEALKKATASGRLSPKTGAPMATIVIFDEIAVEYDTLTQGIWLDNGELEKLPAVDPKKLSIDVDPGMEEEPEREDPLAAKQHLLALQTGNASLSNLIFSSAFTVTGLYALLAFCLITASLYLKLDINTTLFLGLAFAVLQFIFSPMVLDVTLRWMYRLDWASPKDLPGHLNEFIRKVCAQKAMAYPRIGIIEDGSPQAFTYGHTPGDARLVISRGILNLLEPKEIEAVVGHELGHIKHWDMLIMTIAGLVPLILYYIYRTMMRSSRGRGSGKGKSQGMMIGIIAYLLYILSEYIVLWFSRIREYFADRFSGEVTGDPNALSSALVKIGYGLAGKAPEAAEQESKRNPNMEAIRPLGIFDYRTANMLAVTAYSPSLGGSIDKEKLKSAMLWDMWNPWAKLCELQSTHPLIAKRLEALTEQAVTMHQEPYILFDRRQPESYWDEFFLDLAVKYAPIVLPLLTGFALFKVMVPVAPLRYFGLVLLMFGFGYLVNVLFSYSEGLDRDMTVSGLLKKIKVSSVRPVACRIKGRIIGRGVPGLVYSEDFVIKDETGIIFLDYSQPIPFWDFFFGLLKAGQYIDKEVTVSGWYRRSPVPYIEVRSITDSNGQVTKCCTYPGKLFMACLLIGLGLLMMLMAIAKGV
ncbi:MAG: M48 family metalloprotease [Deltaproteobacteria bacterium]